MADAYRLRPMTPDDLETVRQWRNRPEIRENMYTRHEISREEHESYFRVALNDAKRQYAICEDDHGTPVGVVSFSDIDRANQTAVWAFYSGDTNRRGVGSWMEYLALEHAFTTLGLEKLSCEVLAWNDPVIRFHLKHGFRQEGVFEHHHVKDGQRHDVHRLAIFRDAWARHRSETRARLDGAARDASALAVGRRSVTELDVAATATIAELIERTVQALEHAAPGTHLRTQRFEATLGERAITSPQLALTAHVLRRVGNELTVAYELAAASGAHVVLRGTADFTIEDGAN